MQTTITASDLRDRVRAHVRTAMDAEAQTGEVSWHLCVADILHVATRWQSVCGHCGQTIPTGAVGLKTWCHSRTHAIGVHDYQHGCGMWNSPTEVTVDLDDYLPDDDPQIDPEDDPDGDDLAADIADRIHDDVMRQLTQQVKAEQDEAYAVLIQRLTGQLAGAMTRLTRNDVDLDDDDAVADALGSDAGSELDPGVMRESDGRWSAWDYDPRHPGEPVVVYEYARVVRTSDTLHGAARIDGTRIPVTVILDSLADGQTAADVQAAYPSLPPGSVTAALRYATNLVIEADESSAGR